MLNQNNHKTILLSILKDIYSDSEISSLVGFKGGTAAYLFYGLDRFSVDLDFDLLDNQKEQIVFKRIKDIVNKYGQIKDEQLKFFTLFFAISYGEKDKNIKVEISRRLKNSQYETKQYLGIPMFVIKPADMFANKLVAMDERMEKFSRDIYDVWFFLTKMFPINEDIVRERTGKNLSEFLLSLAEKLEKLPENKILIGMGELLDVKQKNWVKNNFKKDTIFQLRLRAQ